ncbi:MAG TPA: hypothetical protein VH252_08610, partial [Chthoniobacterales bacterium]|nr:hypothetical protein [Chthoniobacterales bacterium]
MRTLLLSLAGFAVPLIALAEAPLWQDVKESSIAASAPREIVPKTYRTVRLNTEAMSRLLAGAPMEFSAAAKTTHVIITLPKSDGTLARFEITESPMVSPQVAAEVPDWKTYSGRGIDDPTATARLSWSKDGFRAYVIGADGTHIVDPYSAGDRENYIAYRKQDLGEERGSFHCDIDRFFAENGNGATRRRSQLDDVNAPAAPAFSNGANLRTYRLAIATTGEYTVNRGGQGPALTDVMNAVNRINTVYRRDFAIALTLVSGTNT